MSQSILNLLVILLCRRYFISIAFNMILSAIENGFTYLLYCPEKLNIEASTINSVTFFITFKFCLLMQVSNKNATTFFTELEPF